MPPPSPPSGAVPGAGPATVLVADDDPHIRRLLAMALTQAGFAVVEAEGGVAALELLDARPVSVVLLDHHMPDLDGHTVLERMRARPEMDTVPVILLTAAGGVGDRLAGFSAGADDHVAKPFSIQEVVARVGAHVRARRAWQDTLAAHQRQRATLFRALAVTGNRTSPQGTAQALCNAIAGHTGVASSVLARLTGDGLAVPLAVAGPPLWELEAGAAAPGPLGRHLAARAAVGPWLEGDGDEGAVPGWRPPAAAPADAVACAPIGEGGSPRGVLLLGLRADAGDRADVLSAAVDFAAVADELLHGQLTGGGTAEGGRRDVREVVRGLAFHPALQPIVGLGDRAVRGMEAITRFDDGSSPQERFREADRLGVGLELELATLGRALDATGAVPAGAWVSVNVSPALILAGTELRQALHRSSRPVVLELSEHEAVSDYDALRAAVEALDGGVRLCVDDAGAGFASLRHILHLGPAFVKLDRSWVHGVDADPARQALIAGLGHFARQTGAELIAEGVEREADRRALLDLGVGYGQGGLLGEPVAVTGWASAPSGGP